MDKKILIVGAGYSGVLVSKKLAKRFKKNENVSITIIDKNPFHTMLTELHEVAAGRVDEESIKINLKRVFAGRRVNVVQDTVQSVDFDKRTVIGKNGEYDYDYLILATGSKPTFYGVTGAEEFSQKLWSYEDSVALKDHILNCFRRAVVETDPEVKKKLLTFYVVGAGFTGVEMVGELAEYVPVLCEKYEIERDLVSICIIDMLENVVPTLPIKLSKKVEKRLSKMGVDLSFKTNVIAVGKDFIELKKDDNMKRVPTETVIWAAGIESSNLMFSQKQKLETAANGRIMVDQYLRSESFDNVYVIGDNIFYVPEGEEITVPQTVENCEQSSHTVAVNVYDQITKTGKMEAYKPKFHGIMVCVGGRYGVAHAGTSKHLICWASFFAMFIKHFINIVYFAQVLGYNKIISYLKHEFFTIRNRRSFVGGHFSNRTPSFLLLALRVWLGMVWVFEGVKKIIEGWMEKPMLSDFFGSAESWFNSILSGGASDGSSGATAAEAADAATAATGAGGGEAVGSSGTLILHFDIPGVFSTIFASGKELAESVLSDFALKLDVPLMNWFMDKTILANDSLQLFMQVCIVAIEILIGLALIAGLFTTPSAFVSLVLQFLFLCTTGVYLSSFWMFFAGIALLIGGGRAFGLDYYVMPFLKKKWKKAPLIRRLYLYND